MFLEMVVNIGIVFVLNSIGIGISIGVAAAYA